MLPLCYQVWSFEVGDVLWMRWHPAAAVLFCGTADSQMWMWKLPGGDSKVFTSSFSALSQLHLLFLISFSSFLLNSLSSPAQLLISF